MWTLLCPNYAPLKTKLLVSDKSYDGCLNFKELIQWVGTKNKMPKQENVYFGRWDDVWEVLM